MSDIKKDLTHLLDFAQQLNASGEAPPIPEGAVLEMPELEKVEAFESLEDYGKAHPAPEPGMDSAPLIEQEAKSLIATLPGFEPPPAQDAALPQDSSPAPDFAQDFNSADFNSAPSEADPLASTAPPGADSFAATAPAQSDPLAATAQEFAEQVVSAPVSAAEIAAVAPQEAAPEPVEKLRPAPPQTEPALKPGVERIKQFSEQLNPVKAAVPAAYPFSLLITGHLAPDEKARLLDLLARENMGFREIDLEPQLEAGRVLIPRISEYAGILLVSALRGTSARMRLGPSDTIFATEDTRDTAELASTDDKPVAEAYDHSTSHAAEDLPVTTEATLPSLPRFVVIDVVSASAALKSQLVEFERSSAYQEALEALQRELKYKAFRKGADAILNFNAELTSLHLPSQYRLLLTGSAVKAAPEPPAEPEPS